MTFPIVLAHGVCRIDQLWKGASKLPAWARPLADKVHYFRGVRSALEAEGFNVRHANVGWAHGVHVRARELRANVERVLAETGAAKVNLVVHSMGGLDARHMLFADRHDGGFGARVASLVTIGTPHDGAPVADAICGRLEGVADLERFLPGGTRALLDLRTSSCKAFAAHPEVRRFEDGLAGRLLIRTYAGRYTDHGRSRLPRIAFRLTGDVDGDNDGVVSVRSATWRPEFLAGVWDDTDHVNEIGWQSMAQAVREAPARFLKKLHGRYLAIARALP